ncbi:2-dehydropantoate 2-reductase [Thozetella sp. PMI_491]|nr:2-dehydropantoate 2-reductase [Thozetella sp. PMI_491]
MGSQAKSNILLVGFGGIGAITAYNLEAGGLATVTGVLRSNYDVVNDRGLKIWSVDHGDIPSWKPTRISRAIPNVKEEGLAPYDYIVVCTKNIPDVPPTVSEIIAPAVTPGHTAIVLVQNGLNIEKPVIAAFPTNIVISGISRMSSAELGPGQIFHQDHDILIIGAFRNPNLDIEKELAAAKHFTDLYNASGKATGQYAEDVLFMRWRKLCYNASYNSLCAITGMDTSRLRLAKTPVTELLLPIMMEIKSIARAAGVMLAPDQEDASLNGDAIDAYFRPSMQQDIEKGNFMELEIIVGESVREAQRLGVPAPTLTFIYSLLKALQTKTKMAKGMVELPPMKNYGADDMLAKFKGSAVPGIVTTQTARQTRTPKRGPASKPPAFPSGSSWGESAWLTALSSPLFEKAEEFAAYKYYVDRLAGELQAQDGQDNPYRRLSSMALKFPVLLRTIISCAAEHMHISGHWPIQRAIDQYDGAIHLLRSQLRNWKPTLSESAESNEDGGITADHALLAAILLQPAIIAFSGGSASSAETHLDMAFYGLKQLSYLGTSDLKDVFFPRLLVQRFAMVDVGLSVYARRRPRVPLDSWFATPTAGNNLDKSQPSFRKMTGCPHLVFIFLLRAMHLAADVAASVRSFKDIINDAIMLEMEMRVHDFKHVGSSILDASSEKVARAFTYAALLLLFRRVFGEPSSSPRVQNTIGVIFSLMNSIQDSEAEGERPTMPRVDSASGLPFYLAAREAVTAEDQERVRQNHAMWRKVYPNPARVRLMEVAERMWAERARGSDQVEQACIEIESACDAYLF